MVSSRKRQLAITLILAYICTTVLAAELNEPNEPNEVKTELTFKIIFVNAA